jgi:hypothetical protein
VLGMDWAICPLGRVVPGPGARIIAGPLKPGEGLSDMRSFWSLAQSRRGPQIVKNGHIGKTVSRRRVYCPERSTAPGPAPDILTSQPSGLASDRQTINAQTSGQCYQELAILAAVILFP